MVQTGQGGNAVAPKHVHFTCNDNHRFEQIDRYPAVQTPVPTGPVDLAAPPVDFVAGSQWTYDPSDRLTGLLHTREPVDFGAYIFGSYIPGQDWVG